LQQHDDEVLLQGSPQQCCLGLMCKHSFLMSWVIHHHHVTN
jgi:hypothetical protein